MLKRRRYARFMLPHAWSGKFWRFEDVVVDGYHDRGVWITSVERFRCEEIVRLAFGGHVPAAVDARVAATLPTIEDGVVAHRVRLDADTAANRSFRPRTPTSATLWRFIPATLVEVSRGGGRIELPVGLTPGSVGRLHVVGVQGLGFDDGVRVAWCRPQPGAGSLYHAGIELLPMTGVSDDEPRRSIRDALSLLETSCRGDWSWPEESAVRSGLVRAGDVAARRQHRSKVAAIGDFATSGCRGRSLAQCEEGMCEPLERGEARSGVTRSRRQEECMKALFNQFVRQEEGQDLIEYGLLVGLITVASIVSILSIGPKVAVFFSNLDAKL